MHSSEAIVADAAEVPDPPIEPPHRLQSCARVNLAYLAAPRLEWYTPQHIVNAVIGMGYRSILTHKPRTAATAILQTPAADYWTKDDDGLAQEWHGRVYMNPPMG